jgi:hypothetical protein
MQRHSLRTNRSIYQGFAILIAFSLFVVGRFGFFDILGLKRLFETLIFVPIGLLGTLLILRMPNQWANPFFLLPISYLIVHVCWDWDPLIVADLTGSILIIGIILKLGINFSDLLFRCLLHFATFFAILGIIEFIILLIDPSLVSQILLFYDNYSGSTSPVIQNAMQLLGLADGTSYHLWGMSVTRLRSFTSEPSLLVGYFLVPGALGLTYRGKYIVFGMICIAFSVCSLSGSVFVTFCFSAIACGLLLFKRRKLFTLFPFVALMFFILILYTHYNELILLTKSTAGNYDFLDKTNSANMRFSYIRDFIPKVFSSPFGLAEEIHQPLGMLVGGIAKGGIIGLIVTFLVLYKIFSCLASLLVNPNLHRVPKFGLTIVYGALVTGVLYLDNCFVQLYGFTLLLLIYNRLRQLQYEFDAAEVAPLRPEKPYAQPV